MRWPAAVPSRERGRLPSAVRLMPTVADPSGNGMARAAQLTPVIVSPSSTAKSTPAASARAPAERAGMRLAGSELNGSRLRPLNTSR